MSRPVYAGRLFFVPSGTGLAKWPKLASLQGNSKNEMEDEQEGLPPFVRSWKQLYWLVAANLVALILLFAWFTNAFS